MLPIRNLHIILISFFSIFQSLTSALTPQSCYFGPNLIASDDFFPCYSSTRLDHYACCCTGGKLLEHSACYDQDSGTTYRYGCTDLTFKSAQCPTKCNLDVTKSHWVGLVFCNGTHGMPDNKRICHHPDNCGNIGGCASATWGDKIKKSPPTWCEDLKHGEGHVAFEASWTLNDTAALPVASRKASLWSENADRWGSMTTFATLTASPTTMLTSRTLATVSSYPRPSMLTLISLTISSPTSQPVSNGPGVSVGVFVGVGVGIPVFLLIMGRIFFIFKQHRHKFRHAMDRFRCGQTSGKNALAAHEHKAGPARSAGYPYPR